MNKMSRLVVAGAALVSVVCLVAPTGAAAGIGTAGWGVVCPTQLASFVPPPRRHTAAKYDRVPLAGTMFAKDGIGWSNCGRTSHRATTTLFARPKLTDEEMEERKEQLRVLLSASKEEIEKLVRQNPNVLICSDIEETHGPKLKLLKERLGISKEAAGQLCLKGRFLTCSLENLETKMDWLQARLNLSKSQLTKIVARNVLGCSIENNLEPNIDNIQSGLELSDKELTKLIARQPDVLKYNMSPENIKQRILLLQELLGLPVGDIAKLRNKVIESPQLLFWLEESMKESPQWMKQRFGLGDTKVANMCRDRPELLFSNTTTLDNKADSMQSELSLSDEELRDLVSKYPTVLCCSYEKNLRPKLQYLRVRFELDDDALKTLVLKVPSLFRCSEGDIEDKLQFYSSLIGEREAKRLVVKTYNLLKQSLKTRLKPRLQEVEKGGAKVRWNETLIQRLAFRTNECWERYKLGEAKMGRRKT